MSPKRLRFVNKFCALTGCVVAGVLVACSAKEGASSNTENTRISKTHTEENAKVSDKKSEASIPKVSYSTKINDTGILYGANHPRTVNESCEGRIDPSDEWLKGETFESLEFFGQDCESGRDTRYPDPEDGHAGFDFQKISSTGERLPPDAESWSCVLDEVTGLMWESKIAADGEVGNGGLHDADDQYTWYSTNSNNNVGGVGNWNRDFADCYGYEASNPSKFCNTQAFVARVNEKQLCGFSDWRMPSFEELGGILNYDRIEPAAEMVFFPFTQSDHYWTGTPVAFSSEYARTINFKFGLTAITARVDSHYVRLVRDDENE